MGLGYNKTIVSKYYGTKYSKQEQDDKSSVMLQCQVKMAPLLKIT